MANETASTSHQSFRWISHASVLLTPRARYALCIGNDILEVWNEQPTPVISVTMHGLYTRSQGVYKDFFNAGQSPGESRLLPRNRAANLRKASPAPPARFLDPE